MLTNKDYCDYETCVALKELGFPLVAKEVRYEDNAVFVPGVLLYVAQKWLREEKGVIVGIINNFTIQEFDYYVSTWEEDRCRGNEYTTYENALLRGIKEAVKLLKEKEYGKI